MNYRTKSRWIGRITLGLTGSSVVLIVAILVYLVVAIFLGGRHQFTWEFLTSAPREGMTAGGIFPALVGTVLLVLVMSVLGVPLGTLTAVYLTEYTAKKSLWTQMVRFGVNTLAGIPSIVFGLFGLGFFVQFLGSGMDRLLSPGQMRWAQPNLLWASMTMAFLTIPVVIVSVEEALRAVPDSIREASYALGATQWQTLRKVILPQALPGILTGAILAVGRGAGEVAPILFTGAAYFLPSLPQSLSDQFMNLGYHVYIMSTQSTDVQATAGIQYATVLVLLLVTMTLNLGAVIVRYRFRRSLHRS